MNALEETRVVTRPQKNVDDPNIAKILVAVDLTPHSEKTAAYGAAFAKRVGASVILLHVFPPEPSVEFMSERVYESFERNRRLMGQRLTKLLEQIRATGVKCEDDFRVGDPAEKITESAEELHADLIVTGAHHPGFLGRLFSLDQPPRILHRAGCPVLVYHEGNE
jgi:nucleotide-binding universal stress UspA family protein